MNEDSQLHITYFITGLQYGGANVGMARLLSELSEDEFDITVIALVETSHDVVDMLPDHVRVIALDISSWYEVGRLSRIVPVIRQTDVLVCSLFHATAVGMALGALFRVPTTLVWQHNTSYSSQRRQTAYRVLYSRADQVLADSDATRSMLINKIDVSPETISTLPLAGVDTDRFQSGNTTDEDSITVGTIGRLVEQKDYETLIQVAKQVPEFQFQIVGDGPKRNKLTRQAPDNVKLCGRVDDDTLLERLGEWDVYFQPSRYEGLGITVIEAMACELPVVASNVGGIAESVIDGETGFLCEPGEISCYVQHLEELANQPSLRDKMGSAGRERVISHYSRRELADQFRSAVEESRSMAVR